MIDQPVSDRPVARVKVQFTLKDRHATETRRKTYKSSHENTKATKTRFGIPVFVPFVGCFSRASGLSVSVPVART
jgi:hypothetical protein